MIEPQNILDVPPADTRADLGLWDGGDLVHHQAARREQAVTLVRLDGQADQRRLGAIGGESADGDGVRGVEAIVLKDDDRARLARVGLATGDSSDVAPPHSSTQSDTASMNA